MQQNRVEIDPNVQQPCRDSILINFVPCVAEPKMTIKIYGMWASGATGRVLVLLLEKDIEFDLISVDLTLGDHKQPDYLAVQV